MTTTTSSRELVPTRFRAKRELQDWAGYVARFAPASTADPALEARLRAALLEGDPLADAVVDAMRGPRGDTVRAAFRRALEQGAEQCEPLPEPARALFEQLDRVPRWADRKLLALGADTLTRSGIVGSFALGGVSLIGGYLWRGPTKVLAATGRFMQMAPRRAAETAKFVADIASSPGLDRFSEGFKTTVHVRLMHAFVRRHVAASGTWQAEAYGVPASQHDMLGTTLLFSVAFIYGVERLGLVLSVEEREAVHHLWRYVARLLGTRDDLVPATFDDAVRLFRVFTTMQTGPDEDSRELTRALLEVPRLGKARPLDVLSGELEARVLAAVARDALGDEAADLLGIPRDTWTWSPALLARIVRATERCRLAIPGGQRLAVKFNRALTDSRIETLLAGVAPPWQKDEQSVAHNR